MPILGRRSVLKCLGRLTMFTRLRFDKSVTMVSLVLPIKGGCQRYHQTSLSADHARERGVLIAEYQVVGSGDLGSHEIVEAWVETRPDSENRRLVIRLKGRHHVFEQPRVMLEGDSSLTEHSFLPGGGGRSAECIRLVRCEEDRLGR